MFGKGMEMMLINVIKSLGIDPQEMMEKAQEVITNVDTHLKSFDARLARIEKALNIESEVTTDDKQKQITFDQTDSE